MAAGREVRGEIALGGRFYAISASPLVADGSANVYGRDITERWQAESTLRTTLQRFYDVLSTMYSAVLLVTNDGKVEFTNKAFSERFELEEAPADLVGLSSEDLVEKIKGAYLDPDKAVARIRDILDRGRPVKGEEVAVRNGGTYLRDFVPLICRRRILRTAVDSHGHHGAEARRGGPAGSRPPQGRFPCRSRPRTQEPAHADPEQPVRPRTGDAGLRAGPPRALGHRQAGQTAGAHRGRPPRCRSNQAGPSQPPPDAHRPR